MRIIRTLEEFSAITEKVVVAVGVFDGVHLGHQQVLQTCREQAAARNAEDWVMTFEPHPLQVVHPAAAPRLLTTLSAKTDLLEQEGAAGVMVIPFTEAFANLEPEVFLQQLVQNIPQLKGLVVGENWRFGRKARGDITMLKKLAAAHHIDVHIAQPVTWNGSVISSSRIRQAVSEGRLDDAKHMLGRPCAVRGNVIHGRKRGRRLGFPTANLDLRGCAVPPAGIYAARVRIQDSNYACAVYLSADPEPQHGALEVHVIDFEGDLYGRPLHVDLLKKLRDDDKRFEDDKDLIEQIRNDVQNARAVFKSFE